MVLSRLAPFAFATCLSGPLLAQTVYVDQGTDWTNALRDQFYVTDQGARIMPITWFRALTLSDGSPFLHDGLARYGYIPLPGTGEVDLPVGFSTNGTGDDMAVGMTCAACHTREIEVSGTAYRLDGGPAITDFQSFLKDLDEAVLAVLASDDAFAGFAETVLGKSPDPSKVSALKAEVEVWSKRFHTLIERSLPDPAWGPARLDAVSMIFNRLAGLDLGPESDDYIIADNIAVADAPTRYPFLWNAAKQDFTQWPGFAPNGNDLFGLIRNLGEVYGVFGDFQPTKVGSGILSYHDYLATNSADWEGLSDLEGWIKDIGAPKWPWAIDQDLADMGKSVFDMSKEDGGCVECHGITTGKIRGLEPTWATPIVDAGTDTRECKIMARTVQTGVLEGAINLSAIKSLFSDNPQITFGATAPAVDVLTTSVVGAIIQHTIANLGADMRTEAAKVAKTPDLKDDIEFLRKIPGFDQVLSPDADPLMEAPATAATGCAYESRVLEGIWAAAPYLHNGSVPTLTDLLNPPDQRPQSFVPGPAYDIEKVGMAVDQTRFDHVIETTGCDQLDSGDSRCGHDWGTDLDADKKKALLEYLKSI